MKRNVHNLIWDCIVFLPCLTGLVFVNEEVKKLYLVTCLVTFVQMEVFFLFLNVQHCVKKDVGAMLWLILCHYVFPMTAVISGNRLFLWLVLMVYILSQIFRDRMHFDGT